MCDEFPSPDPKRMEANRRTYSRYSSLTPKRIRFDSISTPSALGGDVKGSMSSSSDSGSDGEDEIVTNITPVHHTVGRSKWGLLSLESPTISKSQFYPAKITKSIPVLLPSPSSSSPAIPLGSKSRPSPIVTKSKHSSPVKITIRDSSSDSEDNEQSTNNPTNHITSPKKFNTPEAQIDQPSLKSLDPGRMLNDTIIEFYMDHVLSNLSQEWRTRIHVFNTFIYNKLKSLQKKVEVNCDTETSFCQAIRRWDKHVRLFDKDFLVMPICDHAHWIMIIICYPDKVPAHDEPLVVGECDIRTGHKTPSPKSTLAKQEPCILIFDSLGFKQMTKFTDPVRDFLTHRWKFERPTEEAKNFKDRSAFREVSARVPKQHNSYDCGIHMLVSFERFVQRPEYFYKKLRLGEDVVDELREPDLRLKRHKIRSLIPATTKLN